MGLSGSRTEVFAIVRSCCCTEEEAGGGACATIGAGTGPALVAIGLAIPVAGALYYVAHPDAAALLFVDANSPHRWLYRFPPARFGELWRAAGFPDEGNWTFAHGETRKL